ncbi:MAG: hypothetical protein KDI36_13980 [Pseudomonadales bacterium]|nr:hypothetical protein [Pseudomonadales bacterium]
MYEVPKIPVKIEITLTNDETIPGMLFVTQDVISPAGNPLIEDLFNNEEDNFVSFQSDAGAFRLINKEHILFLETNQTDEEIKSQTPHEPKSLIIHFANDHTLFGMMYPTQVEELRVSDLLNQKGDFLTLYRQGRKFVVNRRLIIYVNAN